ncbi:serine/threonine/tyrosine protein kinase MPS1 LALA0_S12e00738g [Lachancea lanzarotensis]|uniref:LALA0S12e00738g1_1 n=1 Tax=Lachancea lanzarotensis TaxID=1245769 RepID=A0A0C7NFQ0_9SACH|nr:uncharacterized protein LALA0_S12e00738g [Lachancea lanzarotensis]CEP64520.1 LALA0S12e00738g1_1 [Lachancea lanzarotensis]
MSGLSVRSDNPAHPMRKRELQTLPRNLATSNLLREDSDDENMFGPPQLSNFGSALVCEKENIGPGRQIFKHRLQAESALVHKKNNDTLGSYFNAPGSHTTTYFEGHSDSTMLGSFKDNQQSMTTFNPPQTRTDSGKTYTFNDASPSSSKLKNLQQTLKDELSTRGTRRRNRRFISSRLSLLGPAKRASSSNTTPDRSAIGDDSYSFQPLLTNSPAKVENRSAYSVFHDSEQSVLPPTNGNKDTSATYENIEFGELNPYQYLKKHNLPTTELPNISRAYFERQKGQNRSVALRKNSLTKDAIQSRLASASASASLSNSPFLRQNEPIKREHSLTKREPRRKVSGGPANNISKALSSPALDAATTRKAFDDANDEISREGKYGIIKTPNNSNSHYPKREVLSNIDINSSSTKQPLLKKLKHANGRMEDLQATTNKEHIVSVERPEEIDLPRNFPNTDAKKHVEIVEPATSTNHVSLKPSTAGSEQLQRKRPTVCINGTEYEKLELLGRGGTSKVYKVRNSANNKVYALKRVSFDEFDDASLDGFRGEIELMKKLETKPRVVRLIDHEMNSGVLHVVMECGDHDLSQILAQRSDMHLDVEFVRYHSQEMLKCVKVVHEAGIVHSDLKPANFVFVKGILKIIDFGIANAVPEHTVNIYRETQFGTPNYMAPETLVAMNFTSDQSSEQNKWKVGKPSDIWSCGCIIYQMIYGRPPYGGFQGQNRLLAIMNPKIKIVYPEKTPSGDIVPKTAIDTMKACLERSPSERWTVDEVLGGPFVNPVAVTHFFIRDLIKNSVKYGFNQRELSTDRIEELADDVWRRLGDFRL